MKIFLLLIFLLILFFIMYNFIDKWYKKSLKIYKYEEFLKDLRIFAYSNRTHYFSRAALKLNSKQSTPISILEFYKNIDIYYSSIDLLTLIEHRKIYINNNPTNIRTIKFYDHLVHMKTKDFIYNVSNNK